MQKSPTGEQAFVVSETGGRWGQALDVPGTGGHGQRASSALYTLSCPAPGTCTAGGQFGATGSGGAGQAFTASEVHGTWGQAQQIATALNRGGDAVTESVSCPAAGACAAAGLCTGRSGRVQAFVASQVNGSWGRAQEIAGTLNAGGYALAKSVSCAAAGRCSAGGLYTGTPSGPYNSGPQEAFIATQR